MSIVGGRNAVDVGAGKVEAHAGAEAHRDGVMLHEGRGARLQDQQDPYRLIEVEEAGVSEETISRRGAGTPSEVLLPDGNRLAGLVDSSRSHRISCSLASGAHRF